MRLFIFCFLIVAQSVLAQESVQLMPVGPNPAAFARSTIHYSMKRPIPTRSLPIVLANQVSLTRYYKQRFLLTDTTKANAVWFSLILGYDGKRFWMTADTDYDNHFEEEMPQLIDIPLEVEQSKLGDAVKGAELKFELSSYRINDSIQQPAFSIFVTPVFSFLSEEKNVDSLLVYPSLTGGYKAYSTISVAKDSLLLVLQMDPFMSEFSLFQYYNVKHQQKSYFNLMSQDSSSAEKLVSYINAYDLLIKRKPWNIEKKGIGLSVHRIDYENSMLHTSQQQMTLSESESEIKKCSTLIARNIITEASFQFSSDDSLILYFTGSWCAPCRELTPLVERYFQYLPEGWKGIVIANETSESVARSYLEKFNFQHKYFELLSDKSACSLKSVLSVGVYPTLVYLTPQGKILWSGQHIRK